MNMVMLIILSHTHTHTDIHRHANTVIGSCLPSPPYLYNCFADMVNYSFLSSSLTSHETDTIFHLTPIIFWSSSDPNHIRDKNVNKVMLQTKIPAPHITMAIRTGTVILCSTLFWSITLVLGAKEEMDDPKGPSSTINGPTVEGRKLNISLITLQLSNLSVWNLSHCR